MYLLLNKKNSNIKDFNKAIKNELNPKKGDLLLLCKAI